MGDVFKALASEPRRRMLNHLAGGPMTVGEIAEKFEMELPSISKHLSVLENAGLVWREKRGQNVHYGLQEAALTGTLVNRLDCSLVIQRSSPTVGSAEMLVAM